MTELKKCPFCGSAKLNGPHADEAEYRRHDNVWIECEDCFAHIEATGLDTAVVVTKWNRRAPTETLASLSQEPSAVVNENTDHARWLAETWQMIERCAVSLNPMERVSLSTAGCAALMAEKCAVKTNLSLGKELWRLALPAITVQMLADYGQEGFFEKTDEPVHGVAGVTWSQASVDFACLLQGRLQELLSTEYRRGRDDWAQVPPAPIPSSRPSMTPYKTDDDYIQDLARYCGVSVPRYAFAPSRELKEILERFADALDAKPQG